MPREPLVIAEQGSFFVGGRIVTAPGNCDLSRLGASDPGMGFWVDQMYVQYQVPIAPRRLPLVMVHGWGLTGKMWESTPDGREGFQTILLRRGFSVYIVDTPRRGRSGFPAFNGPLGVLAGLQLFPGVTKRAGNEYLFTEYRLGKYPDYFANTQFPVHGLDDFCKQMVPSFPVEEDLDLCSGAIKLLLDRIGPAILVSHSQSGNIGWLTAARSRNVAAIISYEPNAFAFPQNEVPPPPRLADGSSRAVASPMLPETAFRRLADIPIQIVYGDNLGPNELPPLDVWRAIGVVGGKQFVDAVNKRGGNASILFLPERGLVGNTHFPMCDRNNLEVADLLCQFLKDRRLDHHADRAMVQ